MKGEAVGERGSGTVTAALVTLRLLVGWHFLYEGFVKVVNPHWTSAELLAGTTGPLSGVFHWMVAESSRLAVVDALNRWGLLLVGAGLIAGLWTRAATLAGMLLLALYYLANPPPFGTLGLRPPAEGSYLLVDKVLIELAALWVLFVLPTGRDVGLDRWIARTRSGAHA
jgi:thiosulfate dehydrogenase [quinone] large subunit